MVEIAFALPILLFIRLYSLIHVPLLPYVSWDYVHEDFGNIYHVSIDFLEATLPKVSAAMLELTHWVYPVSSTLFFLLFGLGDESISAYKDWGRQLSAPFRRMRRKPSTEL